mgnify:CR=1 FL=1
MRKGCGGVGSGLNAKGAAVPVEVVRLRAAAVLGTTSLAEDLRSRLQRHRDMLARYREIEARDFTPPPATRDARLRHLVLKAGIRHESNWIDLCVDALEILSAD